MRLTDRPDAEVVAALRAGDEETFRDLLDTYSSPLLHLVQAYVPSRAVAEEVVQETWIAVIKGLDRFEARSSLKTWIFRIATNTAITRGTRERRTVPFSALASSESGDEPSVDADRFLPADHALWPNHWALGPTPWPTPEEGLLAGEVRSVVMEAIAALPAAQRTVISLRDVEGWESEAVSEALEITPGNQRVLLHRARARVRAAIESYYGAVTSVADAETESQ